VTILRLGLALAVAATTLIAIASPSFDPTVVIIVSFGTAASIVGLVNGIAARRRLTGIVDRVRAAAPVVVPGPIVLPRPDAASVLAEVRHLGFDLIGATDTTLDGPPIRTWILAEPSGDTWVEFGIAGRPMAVFVSEGAARFVETAYPRGEPIDDPLLLSQAVTSNEADALAVHREAVAAAGGATRHVTTMDDYLAVEREHRERTGGMRIRSYLERVVGPSIRDWTICLVVGVVALVALLVDVAIDRG
jgi:hypothetical protein